MKIILPALIALSAVCSAAYAGTPIKQDQLPKEARNFIAKHYPEENIRKVEKEQGRRGAEYEVDFTGGAEVEFNEDGSWKDIKAAKGGTVPAAVVPAAIAAHVKKNHAGQEIVEISRKRGGYEIKLSNGSELRLTEDAKPLANRERGQYGKRPRH